MNVTPIFAIALLLPQFTSNKYLQYLIPLSLMLVKDFFLGFHGLMIPVYCCVSLFTILGSHMKNEIYATFVGALMWHLIINFFVWYKWGGNLLNTYIMAIPFDFNLLVSTLICVVIGKICLEYYYRYFVYYYR
jgi:hypothetical protein